MTDFATLPEFQAALSYEPLTGFFYWEKPHGYIVHVGDKAGTINQQGYAMIKFRGKLYAAHRLAWLFTYGEWPLGDLDHINRVRSDNRISNLRECTNSQNQANRSFNRNNTSGFRGVKFSPRHKKFAASIRVNGKLKTIGYFTTAMEASRAYEAAADIHFGEFKGQLTDAALSISVAFFGSFFIGLMIFSGVIL